MSLSSSEERSSKKQKLEAQKKEFNAPASQSASDPMNHTERARADAEALASLVEAAKPHFSAITEAVSSVDNERNKAIGSIGNLVTKATTTLNAKKAQALNSVTETTQEIEELKVKLSQAKIEIDILEKQAKTAQNKGESFTKDLDILAQIAKEHAKVLEAQTATAIAQYEGLIHQSTAVITQKSEQVVETIDSNIAVARNAINSALTQTISAVDSQRVEALNDIEQANYSIQELKTKLSPIQMAAEKLAEQFKSLQNKDQDYSSTLASLKQNALEISRAFDHQLATTLQQHDEMLAVADRTIANKREQILNTIDANLRVARSAIGTALTQATTAIDMQKTEAIENITDLIHHIADQKHRIETIFKTTENLEIKTTELTSMDENLLNKLSVLSETANKHMDALINQEIEIRTKYEAMMQTGVDFNDAKSKVLSNINLAMTSSIEDIHHSLHEATTAIKSEKDQAFSSITQVNKDIDELTQMLKSTVTRSQTLENQLSTLEKREIGLDKKITEMLARVMSGTENLEKELSDVMQNYQAIVKAGIHSVTEKKNQAIGTIDANIETTRTKINAKLNQATAELEAQKKLSLATLHKLVEEIMTKNLEVQKLKEQMEFQYQSAVETTQAIENERKKSKIAADLSEAHVRETEIAIVKMRKKLSEASKIMATLNSLRAPTIVLDSDVTVSPVEPMKPNQ